MKTPQIKRTAQEIQAQIDELERVYDLRGGQGPDCGRILIERAVLRWVLGDNAAIQHRGLW